jgi:hypothetical protein
VETKRNKISINGPLTSNEPDILCVHLDLEVSRGALDGCTDFLEHTAFVTKLTGEEDDTSKYVTEEQVNGVIRQYRVEDVYCGYETALFRNLRRAKHWHLRGNGAQEVALEGNENCTVMCEFHRYEEVKAT